MTEQNNIANWEDNVKQFCEFLEDESCVIDCGDIIECSPHNCPKFREG